MNVNDMNITIKAYKMILVALNGHWCFVVRFMTIPYLFSWPFFNAHLVSLYLSIHFSNHLTQSTTTLVVPLLCSSILQPGYLWRIWSKCRKRSRNGPVTVLRKDWLEERALDAGGGPETLGLHWRTRPWKLACIAYQSRWVHVLIL